MRNRQTIRLFFLLIFLLVPQIGYCEEKVNSTCDLSKYQREIDSIRGELIQLRSDFPDYKNNSHQKYKNLKIYYVIDTFTRNIGDRLFAVSMALDEYVKTSYHYSSSCRKVLVRYLMNTVAETFQYTDHYIKTIKNYIDTGGYEEATSDMSMLLKNNMKIDSLFNEMYDCGKSIEESSQGS